MVVTEIERAAFDILLHDEHILEIDNKSRFPETKGLPSSNFALCSVKIFSERVGEWCWMDIPYSRKVFDGSKPDELAALLRSMISFQLPLCEDARLGRKYGG